MITLAIALIGDSNEVPLLFALTFKREKGVTTIAIQIVGRALIKWGAIQNKSLTDDL